MLRIVTTAVLIPLILCQNDITDLHNEDPGTLLDVFNRLSVLEYWYMYVDIEKRWQNDQIRMNDLEKQRIADRSRITYLEKQYHIYQQCIADFKQILNIIIVSPTMRKKWSTPNVLLTLTKADNEPVIDHEKEMKAENKRLAEIQNERETDSKRIIDLPNKQKVFSKRVIVIEQRRKEGNKLIVNLDQRLHVHEYEDDMIKRGSTANDIVDIVKSEFHLEIEMLLSMRSLRMSTLLQVTKCRRCVRYWYRDIYL